MFVTTNLNTIEIDYKETTAEQIAEASLRKFCVDRLGVKPSAKIDFEYLIWNENDNDDSRPNGFKVRINIEGYSKTYRRVYIVSW